MTTRERLLSAALRLFNEKGYEHTSVTDIREVAEVSNGSFFHAFPSKEALCAELYLHTLAQYHESVLRQLSPEPSAEEGIAMMLRAHIRWVTRERSQARFLFEQSTTSWKPPVRKRQQQVNEKLRKGIGAWAQPFMDAGILRQLAPAVFAAQLIGPTQLICRSWLAGRPHSDPRKFEDELIAAAERALLVNPEPG